MVTKKPTSATRKSTKKVAPAAKKTTTKVTTVKATSAPAKASRAVTRSKKFSFSRAPLLGASVAEFIGTFLLAGVILAASGQPLFVLFGLIAIVLTVGGLSGAHLNPALTIGALATRRTSLVRAVAYIVAQVLGALLALVVMNSFVSAAPAVSQEAAQFGQSAPTLFSAPEIAEGKEWVLLAAELLGSVILAFAVAAATRLGRNGSIQHALTYGGGLYVAILFAGTAAQYVGSSAILNPAVAGALQALEFTNVWTFMIYALSPLVGAVLGFALHDVVNAENEALSTV